MWKDKFSLSKEGEHREGLPELDTGATGVNKRKKHFSKTLGKISDFSKIEKECLCEKREVQVTIIELPNIFYT